MIRTKSFEYIYVDEEEKLAYFLDSDSYETISIPLNDLLKWSCKLPEEGELVPFWYSSIGKLNIGEPFKQGTMRKLDRLSIGMWFCLKDNHVTKREDNGPYQIVSIKKVKASKVTYYMIKYHDTNDINDIREMALNSITYQDGVLTFNDYPEVY